MLLNTSFNMRDEPIVRHPAEALQCFMRSGLDSLVLEDHVVDRSALSARTVQIVKDARRGSAVGVAHDVYTFW